MKGYKVSKLAQFTLKAYDGKEKWDKYVKNNQGSYGRGIIEFAARWANLMEQKMGQGEGLASFAKSTSHQADTDGITGFMYGVAVATLANVWLYGEELRHWHNLDIQIGNEGEAANEEGITLNPALINQYFDS